MWFYSYCLGVDPDLEILNNCAEYLAQSFAQQGETEHGDMWHVQLTTSRFRVEC